MLRCKIIIIAKGQTRHFRTIGKCEYIKKHHVFITSDIGNQDHGRLINYFAYVFLSALVSFVLFNWRDK